MTRQPATIIVNEISTDVGTDFSARQQHGAGKAHHAVSDEEGGRAELRLDVRQMEDAFHGGDQRIDQRGDEAPGEEQAGDDDIGAGHSGRLPLLLHDDPFSNLRCRLAAKNRSHKQLVVALTWRCSA